MPPRWNTWALVQAVQLDYEKAPKERPVRLAAPAASVGDPSASACQGSKSKGALRASPAESCT
jgi:hypothetical protein